MAKGIKGSSPNMEEKPIRTSFNISPSTMKKVRYISIIENKDLTQLVGDGLQCVIDNWEKKNGPVPIK